MSEQRRYSLADEAAMLEFAAGCAPALAEGGVVFLEGDLGMGKTTFARGLLRALGYCGPVKSPTYTLVEPYMLEAVAVYHFDLYRLGDAEEMEYLGAREYFAEDNLCLVEWPQRGEGWLPQPDLRICIVASGTGREITLVPLSPRAKNQLTHLHN